MTLLDHWQLPDGVEEILPAQAESVERIRRTLLDLYRGPIEAVERVETMGGTSRVPHDRYQWPLLAAVLLVTIEGALRERRGTQEGTRG